MEFWRVILIVALGWFLCGTLSTLIPQCSRRLRDKLIQASRQNMERVADRYARLQGYSGLQVRHAAGVDRMSDSRHLGLTYAMLVASGPWALAVLWSVHRRQPETSGNP